MDSKLRKQKLVMWKKQEEEIKKQLEETARAKGQAASEGDLSENAAYQMAVEESAMLSVRLSDVQKMIKSLEEGETR